MTVPTGERIARLDIARCALPLPRPVRIGRTTYYEREYVALRLVGTGGVEGHAIGYTRGLPLDAMLRSLADDVLGRCLDDSGAVVTGARDAHVNAAGSLGRAFSLLDIALADAMSHALGEPLWRRLGAARSRVPIMAVAGYDAGERGADDVVAEVLGLVERGVRHVKLHTRDAAVIGAVMDRLDGGARVGIDASMAYRSVDEAMAGLSVLDTLGLDFIEDPFPPERWRQTGELATRLSTPLAAGEDAALPEALADLASVVAVLRVDATVSGGFGPVLDVAARAAANGVRVMTHAFPDQHAHLAGHPAVGLVELIPDETGLNPVGRLLARRQPIEAGELVLSDEPGHGAPLDWAAVERAAHQISRHPMTDEHEEAGPCS